MAGEKEYSVSELATIVETNNQALERNTAAFESLNQLIKGLDNRVKGLESKVTVLEQAQNSSCTKEDLQAAIKNVKDDLVEQQKRESKKNNVVVFGIPEDENGEDLLDNLLQILLPGETVKIDNQRFGVKTSDRPRPIRLYLNNYPMKSKLLSNLNRLKGLEDFKKVSIVRDLTKAQRLIENESKPSRRTRSQKNKADGEAEREANKRQKIGDSQEKIQDQVTPMEGD